MILDRNSFKTSTYMYIIYIEVPMNVYMKDEIRSASLTVLDP